jgi:PelA/Pel-15E family pectate lyase
VSRRARLGVVTTLLGIAAQGAAQRGAANPMDSIRRLPGYRDERDTTVFLASLRIAERAPTLKGEWNAYVERSRATYARDTASMNTELRASGRTAMTSAPYTHDFSVKPSMTRAWFATDSAQRMAQVILSFQAPNGGWSKHVDFTAHERHAGESYFAESANWEWISTIDNDATTEEIRFLARADSARRDKRYGQAIARGIDYLLASQFPNGCFPQIYPLQGSYHDAATFNDNATVNVLRLLQDVAEGRYAIATLDQRTHALAALGAGVECIVGAQVRVDGRLTAWGQQHDPLTLKPVSARTYELASLASLESAFIVDFLMSQASPSDRVVRAIYAAADWLESVATFGYTYTDYELKKQASAGPIWGRLYEIGSNRVIMANRDGVKLYDWKKLTDRRSGYAWYTTKPAETLATFRQWSRANPRKP